jgi:hypothetical protein
MNYLEAKHDVFLKRAIGLSILLLCAVFTFISVLKFMYFGFDHGGALLANLTYTLKRLVSAIYEKTQYLSLVWKYAPVPNQSKLLSIGNLCLFIWYLGIFVGLSIFRAGNRLSARLRQINQDIEDELIRQSVRNAPQRTRKQIEGRTDIPRQSMWKEIHTLYVAPFVVGIVLLILGKLLGLT